MDFDDSFFEDDKQVQKKEDKRKKANDYYPKICEPEVHRNIINYPYNIVYF